jgi:hypothetical protein
MTIQINDNREQVERGQKNDRDFVLGLKYFFSKWSVGIFDSASFPSFQESAISKVELDRFVEKREETLVVVS